MIACQHGAVKALRGMLYGSRLVPVAFVSELLKFCVCSLSGALPFVVGCQVSGSAFFVVSKVASGGKVDKGTANDSLVPIKHEENINRPLNPASSACPPQGSSTAEEPRLGSPSGPTIHATQHPHTQTYSVWKELQYSTLHSPHARWHASYLLHPPPPHEDQHKKAPSFSFIFYFHFWTTGILMKNGTCVMAH